MNLKLEKYDERSKRLKISQPFLQKDRVEPARVRSIASKENETVAVKWPLSSLRGHFPHTFLDPFRQNEKIEKREENDFER